MTCILEEQFKRLFNTENKMSAPWKGQVLRHICRCILTQSQSSKKCIRHVRQMCTASTGKKWLLESAVCLERYPVITQELEPIEKLYKAYMDKKEFKNSLLSDHELREIEDEKFAAEVTSSGAVRMTGRITALDLEVEWTDEREAFKPADRITVHDWNNNMLSPNRKLDRKLILIIKRKFGSGELWVLPYGQHEEGESMRQTAERALSTQCGDRVKASFIGNAPSAFIQYREPKDIRATNIHGIKQFIFKAVYKNGDVLKNSQEVLDYKWVTKDELVDYFDKKYLQVVSNIFTEI